MRDIRSMTVRSTFMLALLLLAATPCLAQTKPDEKPVVATFDRLPDVAWPGMKVDVTNSRGEKVTGKIQSVKADSLSLKVSGGKTYDVKRDEIQMVRAKPDSPYTGAIVGGAFGVAIGSLLAAFGDESSDNSWMPFALGAGLGVGGYFWDRSASDRRLLYAKSSAPLLSFERSVAGNMSVRSDIRLVSGANRRTAPRAAVNFVVSFGSKPRR